MPDRLFRAFKNMDVFLCATDFDSFFPASESNYYFFIPFLPCDYLATFKHPIFRPAASFLSYFRNVKNKRKLQETLKCSVPPSKTRFYSL